MKNFRGIFLLFVFLTLLECSCGPAIYAFRVEPRVIGPDDSIYVTWKVRGKPAISIHDEHLGADTTYRIVTLTASRHGKEVYRDSTVTVLNTGDLNKVVFSTMLIGDTLVAKGIKNVARWGDLFMVGLVSNPSARIITVIHAGKSADILKKADETFSGTPVSGSWEMRTLLTPAEKANLKLAPSKLSILIILKHK
ncbi:MAG: hypothetical protein JWQ79_2709 [Mucilaginibacter sp.]|nr:hypothetical protein [Mucilaginibacter sp.]